MAMTSRGLAAWCVEATSAVLMILCNKALMTGSFAFKFPTTLTAAHFAWTGVGSSLYNSCGTAAVQVELPPWQVVAAFVLLSSLAIILSNASLLLNSVAFYQMVKLATLPFVACLEWTAKTKTFTWWHPVFYAAILGGVATTIVGDVASTHLGMFVATISFMSAGLHQFFCARLQARYGLSPSTLLSIVSPFKAVLLFAIGPFLDGVWFGNWIHNYQWTLPTAMLILVTCMLAIALNLAQYTVIHLLGAGTYQALSQLKTASVVVLGSMYFQGRVSLQQVAGTAITLGAVLGLAKYEQHCAALQQDKVALPTIEEGDACCELGTTLPGLKQNHIEVQPLLQGAAPTA